MENLSPRVGKNYLELGGPMILSELVPVELQPNFTLQVSLV